MKLSERVKENPKKYFLIFLLMLAYCIPLVFFIQEKMEMRDKKDLEKVRIKSECDLVYKTIERRTTTSIYSCPPNDVKYEFTERE